MIMKSYTHIITITLLTAALMVGCTKDFEEINTNPNAPEKISPEFLMSEVIISTAYGYQDHAYEDKPASAGRYITLVRNEGDDLFGWSAVGWDAFYTRLTINKSFQELAQERGLAQYVAVSKILGAFNYAFLTDLWGDIPYSEALASLDQNIIHPAYDKQENIYQTLLTELKDANDMLATTTEPIDETTDVLYHGDAMGWRKLANSLRLRLLLRASTALPDAYTDMQDIVSHPEQYPVFSSNEDNAELEYLGNTPDDSWPGGDASAWDYEKRRASKELVDKLYHYHDPRMSVWLAPVVDKAGALVDTSDYVGVPNAIQAPYDYNGGETHMSTLNEAVFRERSNPLVKAKMMTYTEVLFILAEAAQRSQVNMPGETAESLYYKGIQSSMQYYGVGEAADSMGYDDQPAVAYQGTMQQLMDQKWLAMFLMGGEGWFDYRRTGYPAFVVGPSAAQRTIPLRYPYPEDESLNNHDQYEAGVAQMGGDDRNTKMWYLK